MVFLRYVYEIRHSSGHGTNFFDSKEEKSFQMSLFAPALRPCSLTGAKHPPDEKLKERKRKQPLSLV
jgi:hypothetical protein